MGRFTDNELCEALRKCRGNQAAAARGLGVSVSTLRRWLYALPADDVPIEVTQWSYSRNHNRIELRNRIGTHYFKYAVGIARQVHRNLNSQADFDDVVSAATGPDGLLRAIERYQPAKHRAAFKTYASARIQGAAIDAVRKIDYESRRVRGLEKKRWMAEYRLAHELGRKPTRHELAERLGWDLKQLEASYSRYVNSLYAPMDQVQPERSKFRRPAVFEDTLESRPKQERGLVFDLLTRGLEFDARCVLYLYYFKQHTMKSAGEALRLSESRVSQLHSHAIEYIREHVDRDEAMEAFAGGG